MVVGAAAASERIYVMQHEERRSFLARPFWRDYVLSYVLIGIGFTMVAIGAPQRGADRWFVLVPAFAVFGLGFMVFFCAVGWSLRSSWRSRRSGRAA